MFFKPLQLLLPHGFLESCFEFQKRSLENPIHVKDIKSGISNTLINTLKLNMGIVILKVVLNKAIRRHTNVKKNYMC